jgi:multiple sugar transport system ATP-binding protein
VQHDTPTRVYAEPASRFVGGFIGNPPMNFLAGRLGGNGRPELRIGEHAIELPAGTAPAASGETLVGIRAENIVPATEPSPGALPARTQVVEPLGSHLLLTAAIGEQLLKVVAPVDFPAQPNRDLWLRLEPAKLRLFELDGDRLPASTS